MNTELFIARRLFFDKKKSLARRIINIALAGIALGLAVMIISVAVVTGFKQEIRNKLTGFAAHFQLLHFDLNDSFETQPVNSGQACIAELKKFPEIQSIDVFATKPGIIKTDEYIQGIIFKGVSNTYDLSFFSDNLLEGKLPQLNDTLRVNDVIISEQIAGILKLKTGDPMYMYFVNEGETNPRMIQFRISGIYRTSLEEFDKTFIIGDIKHVQRLNDWTGDQVSGFEIRLTDFGLIDKTDGKIKECVAIHSEPGNILRVISITGKYPQLFDWLSVLDINVWVILALMLLVAGFNMISGLLVIILEKSNMIGVLKALGSNDWNIRKIFLYLSGFLTGRGLLWGNIAGIAVILIQMHFHVIHLNPESYYVEVVPVSFSWLHILELNIGTLVVTLAMLLVPSQLIGRMSPDKTIRFD